MNYTVSDIDDAAASEGESLLGKVEDGMREREWCERKRGGRSKGGLKRERGIHPMLV